MAGTIVSILVVVLLALYVIVIFVYDYKRRKKGAPSIFVEACESEGHGKRLVKAFKKAYPKQK